MGSGAFGGAQGTAGTWQRRPKLAAGTRSNAGSANLSRDLLPQLLAFLLLRLLLYSNQGLMSKITTANAARCSSVLSADLYHPAAITSLPGAHGLGSERGASPKLLHPPRSHQPHAAGAGAKQSLSLSSFLSSIMQGVSWTNNQAA